MYICLLILFLFGATTFSQVSTSPYIIKKGKLSYDFSFAELAVKYLETEDSLYLVKIASLNAVDHILRHANQYHYNVPKKSSLDLVKYLLTPIEEKKKVLAKFKRNLEYAKREIADADFPQQYCLKYLPEGFEYSGSLFFTFGYDLGVAFDKNASVNLAHPNYLENMSEIRYYSLHELHHAGLLEIKSSGMPSLAITNYRDMLKLIDILTQLEGMGTYAPLAIRKEESAMNTDKDYVCIQDDELMKIYEQEYFEIYNHFKNNPNVILTDKDWKKLSILSNKRRLWYRVGALMAQKIDEELGREKLTELIIQPSGNFILTYMDLRKY